MIAFRKYVIVILSLAFLNEVNAQYHWESLVLETDTYQYLIPETEPPAEWIQLEYNDTDWESGFGGFGYADDDDNTVFETAISSLYLRKLIEIPPLVPVLQLILDIDYDDAFVAYINGIEVARSGNLLEGTPGIEGSVTVDHEARMYTGGLPERFILDPGILSEGDNVLAVHIMNIGLSSSDLSSRIFLSAELETENSIFHPTPSWFEEPMSIGKSNLPLIRINTEGKAILDEPKIMALMKIINNPDGMNSFNDTVYEYDGHIGIEIRGNTAQMFPKKSYTIETRLSTGENNNVSILGMPEENDWALHGPYSDKSLMRNAFAYYLGNNMGNGWHPKAKFVEVEINNEYRGIYLLVEKIKIDKNRVDIANLLPGDTTGNELTGGYIISIDRDQEGSWNSPFLGRTGSVDVPFSYIDPKYNELAPQQRSYIREYITDFEYALDGNNYKDPELGYQSYINTISFIDYFIITELSKDLDGYRVSVYFHKDKDSRDSRLTMTPFWDYNICFGNANFFSAGNPIGWASDGIGAGDWYEIPFWWDKFRTDPYFESLLRMRWLELRQNVISKTTVNHFIDSVSNFLSDAQVRNFEKFDILRINVWPNNYIGGTYENEVNYLKNWVNNRIDWLDDQILSIRAQDLSAPLVATSFATGITKYSAFVGGNVTDNGGGYVWDRGLYIGGSTDLMQNGRNIKLGKGVGDYTYEISELLPSTSYYFRAYAENDLGLSLGDIHSFTTAGDPTINVPGYIVKDYNVRTFPNPFSDKITIQFKLEFDSQVKIVMTNISGQIVNVKQKDCYIGTNLFQYNASDFQDHDNMYFYNILIDNQAVKRGKIIKQ